VKTPADRRGGRCVVTVDDRWQHHAGNEDADDETSDAPPEVAPALHGPVLLRHISDYL
jgi:hypothetical protein